MMAGVVDVELQPFPHRSPSEIALLIATVSSVDPSLSRSQSHNYQLETGIRSEDKVIDSTMIAYPLAP